MDLKEAREELAAIDREIVTLIKKRSDFASVIRDAKKESGTPVRDEKQRMGVLLRAMGFAEDSGLDPERICEIFEILIEMNEDMQRKLSK
ncbi:chorismate mutase [Methanoplanus sp. FWC-SCC4]|uniref:Chorismate mutase n=1 Tax=Methanochimaera problematica TaxID=2609417 RepID=A0AA97FA78_9EURY|nr:chorismate mutase [Methanoplanus sp. FWC-SCC4]WOF15234.1 chorismate mutase [Methanoplanus sp. FWC-SCC4]